MNFFVQFHPLNPASAELCWQQYSSRAFLVQALLWRASPARLIVLVKSPWASSLAVGDSLTVFPPAEPPDLHVIHQRIQGNMEVLQDFGVRREEGRSRQEYLALLRRDMAAYYSYSDFLLTKLMDIFPLPEVGSCP